MISGKHPNTNCRANIIGPQIRRFRVARGWSQAKLAMQLQLDGMDITREFIAQIEAQTHCVKDRAIPYFAHVLKVDLADLFFGNQNGQRSPAAIIALLQATRPPNPRSESCNEIITTCRP